MFPRQKKKFPSVFLYGFILAGLLYHPHFRFPTPTPSSQEPLIKILLRKASNQSSIVLRITGPYKIIDATGEEIYIGQDLLQTPLSIDSGAFQIGAFRVERDWLKIILEAGSLVEIQDISYRGSLILSIVGQKIQSVLELPMEQYLLGVIGSEMSNTWSPQCLEAQALVARTYAMYYYQKSAPEKNYHVEDTVSSQVFYGLKTENEQVFQAVQNTRGIVLKYAGKLFPTYFHSTCAGHTASALGVLEHTEILPLSGVPCPYCQDSKYYSWEVACLQEEILVALESLSELPSHQIMGIHPLQVDASGRSQQINLLFDNGVSRTYKSNDFRRVIGYSKLRSLKFEGKIQNNQIVFHGGGFGHGVGMCQMGAKKMSELGFYCRDIVLFYYPGATLEKIW